MKICTKKIPIPDGNKYFTSSLRISETISMLACDHENISYLSQFILRKFFL